MSAQVLQDLMRQVDALSTDELLHLLVYIAERARLGADRPMWSDICGIASDLMDGEDAQAWVTRSRRESSEHREALLQR
ncbi:MAG: hypothetical protein FJZ90_18820 [Chloroflexi bacterium]|nr:hypothetical protein [Chloroflexota bacterium]